jgi:hypothetical protein
MAVNQVLELSLLPLFYISGLIEKRRKRKIKPRLLCTVDEIFPIVVRGLYESQNGLPHH